MQSLLPYHYLLLLIIIFLCYYYFSTTSSFSGIRFVPDTFLMLMILRFFGIIPGGVQVWHDGVQLSVDS